VKNQFGNNFKRETSLGSVNFTKKKTTTGKITMRDFPEMRQRTKKKSNI